MGEEHEHEYELVMPFVVCRSQGGPYDDEAFVAGCRFRELKFRLEVGRPTTLVTFESPDLIPQLDLLAMDLGYHIVHIPWPEASEEWEQVTFSTGDLAENDEGEQP